LHALDGYLAGQSDWLVNYASAWAAVGGFVRGAGQFVEDLNAYVDRETAIQRALSKPTQIYDAEKQAISLSRASRIGQRKDGAPHCL
jgi:hypothetical protein